MANEPHPCAKLPALTPNCCSCTSPEPKSAPGFGWWEFTLPSGGLLKGPWVHTRQHWGSSWSCSCPSVLGFTGDPPGDEAAGTESSSCRVQATPPGFRGVAVPRTEPCPSSHPSRAWHTRLALWDPCIQLSRGEFGKCRKPLWNYIPVHSQIKWRHIWLDGHLHINCHLIALIAHVHRCALAQAGFAHGYQVSALFCSKDGFKSIWIIGSSLARPWLRSTTVPVRARRWFSSSCSESSWFHTLRLASLSFLSRS